jgi:hypothetical protein
MVAVRTPTAAGTGRLRWVDLAGLGFLTVALRLPAFLASAHLTFDDGVYGASAVAMRAGGQPFRDVFSSQGPLFLPLVYVADAIGLRTANAPRVLSLAAALLLVGATYVAGRTVTDRGGACLAAGLVAATTTSLFITGPVAADGAALAFATLTIALVLRWQDDITLPRAVWLGVAISATVSVKALLGAVILPVAVVLLAGRRFGPIVVGAAAAVASHLVLWVPWGAEAVWAQSYEYHLEVAKDRTPGANLLKVLSTMGDRDSIILLAAGLALAAVLLRRRAVPVDAGRWAVSPDVVLLVWVGAGLLVLLTEHPMWRPHVSQLIPGLALLAARHRPSWRVLAVAGVVALPYYVVHAWPMLHPEGYEGSAARAVDLLEDLPEEALAISDEPGLVWRSGHRTPPDLVDASVLRIETGDLTGRSVAAAAADTDVCAVVVTSRARWGRFEDLPRRLDALGYDIAHDAGRHDRVYLRAACPAG